MLAQAVKRGCSDLHLKVGAQPMMRINGKLRPMLDYPKMEMDHTAAASSQIMNLRQKKDFKETHECDLAYSLKGVARFRVNVFQQRGTVGIVFRTIQARIKTIRELMLPSVLEKLCQEKRGLILVTGATGSGKSTTLAAMIDWINTNKSFHIITIEDPIEFLHRDKQAIVNQREVGSDTEAFGSALRASLRQDPDVILVGEMRDHETIHTAMVAAETGHLVLSTLHTVDAMETINRIIGVFPPDQQEQVRVELASVLRGIVSQRLVPRKDGRGRIGAIEVLVNVQNVKEAIMDPTKTSTINDMMSRGMFSHYGMQSFDQHLIKLVKRGLVSYEDALSNSSKPDDFALQYKGIGGTSEMGRDDEDDGDSDNDRAQRDRLAAEGISLGSGVDMDDDDPFADNPFEKN